MNIGFIGAGNMAFAICSALKKTTQHDIFAADHNMRKRSEFKEIGIDLTDDNNEVASKSDILILSVKPNMYDKVCSEISGSLREDSIIITIAAGISLKTMSSYLGSGIKIARTMPNTPAIIGQGVTAVTFNENMNDDDKQAVISILESFSSVYKIDEKLMDAVPAISGSSPAYAFMFIEALADGAVRDGFPRAMAYEMAAKSLLGAAQMVLESSLHPAILKDNVCSPGGTTIEAVAELEKTGFRSSIISAMKACTDKSKEMSGSGS